MIATDSFHIITLQADDAKSLSEMMVLNFDNFKRYFPITLSKNQSFDDSLKYIEEKRKENDLKSEFTFLEVIKSFGIDEDFDFGISLEAALYVAALEDEVIEKFISDFNANSLKLDSSLYSFKTEEE